MSAQRGTIKKRKTAKGAVRWDARYRPSPSETQISKTFDRKIDAETWLQNQLHKLTTGEHVDRVAAKLSFDDVAQEWLSTRVDVAEKTRKHNEAMLAHASDSFGSVAVSEITARRVQALINEKEKTHSSNTVTHIRRVVRQVLDYAVEINAVPRNVAAGRKSVKVPTVERKDPVIVSLDQMVALADKAPDRYRAMILLAATTGLRYSEIAGLRVHNFDRKARTITVTHQLDRDSGEFKKPKAKSRRTIKLADQIVFVLARHINEHSGDGSDALIFTSPEGERLHYNNFRRRVWNKLVREADLDDLGFHDLRHSHAVDFLLKGGHVKALQARLGHSSIKTTLDVYGHYVEGMDEAAASAIDAALRDII